MSDEIPSETPTPPQGKLVLPARRQRPQQVPRASRGQAVIPTTRAEAKAVGEKRFVTGKPCARGHVAPRSVHRGECLGCISERRFAQRCDPAVREELNRRDRERQRRSYQDPELRRRRLDCNSASKRRRRTRGNP